MKRAPRRLPTTSGIYSIAYDVTGKHYVGQTLHIRSYASKHLSKLTRGIDYNPPLQAAYTKHGSDNFTFTVLELCEPDVLTEREQWHMDATPPGMLYNTKPAGPSGSLGILQPEDQKLKHSRAKGGRPFYAYHEATGAIRRFEHVGEAVRSLPGLQRAHVYSCLHGNRYSHAGYTFDYDPDVPAVAPKHDARRPRGGDDRSRAVIATDIETGLETSYAYIAEVRDAGFSPSGVYNCLTGLMRQHKGFSWRYADGKPHRPATTSEHLKGARKHGGSKPVIGTHKVTGEVVRFTHIKAAAEALGVFPQNISASIRNAKKKHATAGYLWAFDI